ncbi:fasciclin-like arabinogalactan protein 6 [Cucumis melo var. makuwa]|uniref:Fasciclin-like arabinogalactan protein 6 n=1 Tax=Cucumis melo var. makuwa TaxID=1194695 RepID=A0A5A7UY52_CUCMM|nr:fasciclin-like arabinogalactan protein 6 [Cucumis melo var. makuwa]TYK21631.1 fasciclin-like arabinogalactan protein 6 [Cucumis melo var. makuwa]
MSPSVGGGQFSTFIRLLNQSRLIIQLDNQLNNSQGEGLTILAPTDNGFNALESGALNSLDDQQKSQLLLYHVLPKFYTLTELQTISNPVRTQAGDWGLNFTGQANSNQVNVSTGVVTVPINNKLREQSPLSVFVVDKVLLPEALFGNHTAAPPPKAPAPGADKAPVDGETPPKSDAAKPPANDKGAAARNGVGLGLIMSFGLIVISVVS